MKIGIGCYIQNSSGTSPEELILQLAEQNFAAHAFHVMIGGPSFGGNESIGSMMDFHGGQYHLEEFTIEGDTMTFNIRRKGEDRPMMFHQFSMVDCDVEGIWMGKYGNGPTQVALCWLTDVPDSIHDIAYIRRRFEEILSGKRAEHLPDPELVDDVAEIERLTARFFLIPGQDPANLAA